MPTLLEKAKAVKVERKRSNKITSEQIEVAIAWMRGEVNSWQVMQALGHKSPQYLLARWLQEAYNRGYIVIAKS